MKKTIIMVVSLLLITGYAYGAWESYVVEMPDGSVQIHNFNLNQIPKSGGSTKTLEETLEDAGLSGLQKFKIIDADLPVGKGDFEYWERQGNKVKVNQQKKNADIQAQQEHEQKLLNIRQKMGLTKEEFDLLQPKEKVKKK